MASISSLKIDQSQMDSLDDIASLDGDLETEYGHAIEELPHISRNHVSFQANKTVPIYRWFKYKEGFSAALVTCFLNKYGISKGPILDPFAGSGTALFAASGMGIDAEGIELLPVGCEIIRTRKILENELTEKDRSVISQWANDAPWKIAEPAIRLNELAITENAYPPETKGAIERYLSAANHTSARIKAVLRFALLCVLESISYTRKDGQYLRWDYRSGRRHGHNTFDKGRIESFDDAISNKLKIILDDIGTSNILPLPADTRQPGTIALHGGSCLDIMPSLAAGRYTAIVTSPPYCNRYDYTRTYALELAMLGIGAEGISALRQQMLSCTVENRRKNLLSINPAWSRAIEAADDQPLLQAILAYLDAMKAQGKLNNNGIPRMVRGYFYEMACVIAECARVLATGSPLIMVNDNVRYAGASLSVDTILSDIANCLGFSIETIFVLPNGKGNSSQQMGAHGRKPLRKCIYVWRKS